MRDKIYISKQNKILFILDNVLGIPSYGSLYYSLPLLLTPKNGKNIQV